MSVRHEDKRKARAFEMVNIISKNEGSAPKVIISKFCMQTGLSLDKGREFFQMLRESGTIETNKDSTFIKEKMEEPVPEQKKDPRLTEEENKIVNAEPEVPEDDPARN